MKESIARYLGLSLWHVFAIGLGFGAVVFLLMYFNEVRIKGWLARRKNDGDWPVARIEKDEHDHRVAEARMNRQERQRVVAKWCIAAFGEAHASGVEQRALRFLEESIEAFQAAGGNPEMAHKLIDYIFARPVGDLKQEFGGIGVTLLAFAQAAGVDADEEECREIERVLNKPDAHWRARNNAKNEAGFNVTPKDAA